MNTDDILAAWNHPDARNAIHPTRGISEDAYRESGRKQAELIAADLPNGARVVDFGCGDGRVTIPLAELGYDVTGVDASENMLAALHDQAPDIPAVRSDGTDLARALGLGKRKVDAVVCLSVLIHHDWATGAALIEQLRGIVKKNGLLILDWPVSDQPVERGTWLEVTTWDAGAQEALAGRLKMERADTTDRPWTVWRAT